MKKFLVLVVGLILFGCKKANQTQQIGDSIVLTKEEYESLKRSTIPEYPRILGQFTTWEGEQFESEISVIAIDSCEYVGVIHANNSDILAHKGNCKFCRERREKYRQEMIDEILYRLTHKAKDSVQ